MARVIIFRGNQEVQAAKAVTSTTAQMVSGPAQTRRTVIIKDGQFVGAAAKKKVAKAR